MTTSPRPLLLTTDPELLDDLLGAAAAVGIAVDVSVDPAHCGPQWSDAPLVLVGADVVRAVTAGRLGRRPDLVLVGRDGVDPADLTLIGADELIELPRGETRLLDRLADVLEPTVPSRVIGVVPGRGGAGASVLAAGLALTAAARGGPAWLVDLDPLGGGADVGMGAEVVPGARWDDLTPVAGRLSASALRTAVPEVHGVRVLAAGRGAREDPAPEAVSAVLTAARRGGGTVVLDLPRHRSPARDAAVAAAADLFVVVPAELRALLAATGVLAGLGAPTATAKVVVRPVPHGLPPMEVLRALQAPLAGVLEDEAAVQTAAVIGDGTGLTRDTKLRVLCERLLDAVGPVRSAA